jgi:hypothetical protein
MFYVYEHWRPDRDEPFYVGKGRGSRANMMARRNLHHRAIQAKLHKLGMAVEVRIVADGLSEEKAFEIEKYRIKMWRDAGIDLANKSDGGEGNAGHIGLRGDKSPLYGKVSMFKGKKHLEETKKIISEKAKGKPKRLGTKLSDETKEKIRLARIGQKMSDKTRENLSKIRKGKKLTYSIAGEKNPFFGKKHSEETKLMISEKKSGINHPFFGKKDSEEVKANKSNAARLAWKRRRENIGT